MARAKDGQPNLRRLPSVDRLLQEPPVREACEAFSRPVVLDALRAALDDARRELATGRAIPTSAELIASAIRGAEIGASGSLQPLINATGVIIHTNLGRAPLSREAIAAMTSVASEYSNLEYDLAAGERGSRHSHLEPLLCQLTGAEAALAVNNNAAAVLLALSALAAGREVVIARGQLVEIGGGFRIPDVLRQSGARLVEVGTTNRSYVADYEAAIGADAALLMRVHPSNFRVVGFTHEAALAELVAVAGRYDLAVVDDLGSGALLDTSAYGLAREPLVQESVAAGAGLVCFSGDKLLGGPQAGLIVGRRALVERLRRHPLARAIRLDKASIAGLQATLLHYKKQEAVERIPLWRCIATPLGELEQRATALAGKLNAARIRAGARLGQSTVGGGSLPGETLPSWLVAVGEQAELSSVSVQTLSERLRRQRPPVIGRIERDQVVFDLRTVFPEQDPILEAAIRRARGQMI